MRNHKQRKGTDEYYTPPANTDEIKRLCCEIAERVRPAGEPPLEPGQYRNLRYGTKQERVHMLRWLLPPVEEILNRDGR